MDWDLWESSYDQETVEGNNNMQSEWQCDFYCGYGHDVIEENALNDKSCIQVLRIQIAKMDTEIGELEKNLVSLQTELSFVEDENWPEILSKALREKIHDLDISVRSLRNKSQIVTEVQLSIHREPAEKLEDVLKTIMRKHLQETEKQPPLLINLEPNSDALAISTKLSKSRKGSQLVSDISIKEEAGETNAPEGSYGSKVSTSKLQEKNTDCSKEIKVIEEQPSHINTIDPGPACLRLAAGSANEEDRSAMIESGGIAKQLEAIEKDLNSKDGKMVENESLNHEENRGVEEVAQTAEVIVKASSSDSIVFSNECLSVVKSLCKSDMTTNQIMDVAVEVRKEHATTTDDLHCEKDQAYDVVPKAIVEFVSLETFIESAAVNSRNGSSESNFSTSIPENGGDNDMDEKLVEILRQVTGKDGIRGSKIGKVTIKAEPVGEPENESQKAISALHKSCSSFIQPLQSQMKKSSFESDSQGNITAGRGVEKPGIKISQNPFDAFDKSHLTASLKPQSQRAKRKSQLDSQSIGGQSFPLTKKKCNASSLSTYKRQKDDTDDVKTSLKQLRLGKHSKKLTPLEPPAKEHVTLPIGIQHPLPQLPRSNPNLPLIPHTEELTIDLKFPDPHTNASNGGSIDNNSNSWALVPVTAHAPTLRLEELKVPELKAIAKRHKLNSYSKLKKDDLIKFLAERLGSEIQR